MASAGLGPGHSGDQKCGEQRPVGPQDQHTGNHTRPEAECLEGLGCWVGSSTLVPGISGPCSGQGGTWSAFLGWSPNKWGLLSWFFFSVRSGEVVCSPVALVRLPP